MQIFHFGEGKLLSSQTQGLVAAGDATGPGSRSHSLLLTMRTLPMSGTKLYSKEEKHKTKLLFLFLLELIC